jgi:hypothetical protein
MAKKLCEICGEKPATVPDRERMGRLINRVCSSCHALRLAGDMKRIMELHEQRRSDSNAGLDDAVRYWLCCGSKDERHSAESCHEAQMGHPERVRYGTAKEHSEWQRNNSSNAKVSGGAPDECTVESENRP